MIELKMIDHSQEFTTYVSHNDFMVFIFRFLLMIEIIDRREKSKCLERIIPNGFSKK